MKNKITLTRAVLFCLNILIGAGLFLNPKVLVGIAGPLCFVGYLIAAAILFPLILCLAELATFKPVSGGLYVYSKEYLNQSLGFLSAWSFFIAKTVSAIFILHSFTAFVQSHTPLLSGIPVLFLDYFVVSFIAFLNMVGVSVGGRAQYVFTAFKIIPLIFAFLCGFSLFDHTFFMLPISQPTSLLHIIPVSLYTLVGFEVICSIGGMVKDPEKNIKRAMLFSFGLIVAIGTLFTAVLYAMLGPVVAQSHEALLMLGVKMGLPVLGRIINGIVFVSLVGGAFSMILSNCWNLYALAEDGHFPFKKFLTKINRFHVPWVSLIIEVLIAIFVITITTSQVPLQNMSIFALFICYILTALAAYKALLIEKRTSISKWVPLAAVFTCSVVVGQCLRNIYRFGVSFSFLFVFLLGCFFAAWKLFVVRRNV